MKSRRRIAFLTLRLQQGFAARGMGFRGQFAQQQSSAADIEKRVSDVRYSPKSRHR
jgi:hypothetical protein